MVFVQGLTSETGPSVACLKLFEEGSVRLLLSQEVLDEIGDVLSRPKLRRKFPRLTASRLDSLRQLLRDKAELVTDIQVQFSLERDPKDAKYLNLALSAGAEYLVTRDRDLLDLMDEQRPDGQEFRRRFPALTILDPVEFLRSVRNAQSDSDS